MSAALAAAATGLALTVWCRARVRLERIARAEHELRGALHAAGLVLEGRGCPAGAVAQLERARVALADLTAARTGARTEITRAAMLPVTAIVDDLSSTWGPAFAARGRPLHVDGAVRADVRGDRVRLGGAASNLLANALEHGRGPVRMHATAVGGRVRLEVSDAGRGARRRPRPPLPGRGSRGRGLAIAARVARAHGGRLVLEDGAAAIELPAAAPVRGERS